jgi:hypothetical protein
MTHLGDDGTLATNEHRKAILSTTFKETGLGVVADTPVKGVTDKPAGTFIETFASCT